MLANLAKIRREILRAKGREPKPSRQAPRHAPASQIPQAKKTLGMRMAELKLGKPIEEIVLSGTLHEVGARLGVDYSTISKWIKRLGLRYTLDNLPKCEGCQRMDSTCQATKICHLLLDQSASYNLVAAKTLEMMGGQVIMVRNGIVHVVES